MKLARLLTEQEHKQMNDDAIAKGFWRDDPRIFAPGTAWYLPWIHDPNDPEDQQHKHSFLSEFYYRDWASKRPPLLVICPNGQPWIIDQKSINGPGWEVTGEFPNITCSPSIEVTGYHGWLRNGEFSPDIEGRGENGIVQPIKDRTI